MISSIYPFLEFKDDCETSQDDKNILYTIAEDFYNDISGFFQFLSTTDLIEMCLVSAIIYNLDS
jgi:hypothetical protein